MYVLPLSDIIRRHSISLHTYADDTQLYVEFDHKDPNSLLAAVQQLESCVEDIRIWMLRNKLKMNDSKTEMIVFAQPRVTIPDLSVSVGSDVHHPVTLVKNLGVVHQICSACATTKCIREACTCIHISSSRLLQRRIGWFTCEIPQQATATAELGGPGGIQDREVRAHHPCS